MKKLTINEMQLIQGGNPVGKFCVIWARMSVTAGVAAWILSVPTAGVSTGIALGVDAACAVYGAYSYCAN